MGKTWFLWCRCAFSFGFFFFNKHVLIWVVGGGGFHDKWDLGSQKVLSSLRTLGRTNFGPAQMTEPPGHKPLIVNVVVVGPFEEEEKETGVASDVVKVRVRIQTPQVIKGGQGEVETSAISDRGCVSLGSLTMKPRYCT